MTDVEVLRHFLSRLEPSPSHDATSPPKPEEIYSPSHHHNALDPERTIVYGGRGTGKSFWSACLLDDSIRGVLATAYPSTGLQDIRALLGFGGVEDSPTAPNRETIDQLEAEFEDAEKIWRAVILRGLTTNTYRFKLPRQLSGRNGLVNWVVEDAERAQNLFRQINEQLSKERRKVLILFDALDRVGSDWAAIHRRTRALLRVALGLRSYSYLKLKIFLRTDQYEDRAIISFPDASKLITAAVALTWRSVDLFGLLYLLLANDAQAGPAFERLVRRLVNIALIRQNPLELPEAIKQSEETQMALFVGLAGPYMGSNARKGRTYTWLYNHLADARREVSPRSFLEAIRAAAERTPADAPRALHYKGIQAGLQSASRVRVAQLQEEYGWIGSALKALAELRVPCPAQALYDRWTDARTIQEILRESKQAGFLMPVEFEGQSDDALENGQGLEALLLALKRIGVAETRPDGRINIPDIYRIAAVILKRGGVPPIR